MIIAKFRNFLLKAAVKITGKARYRPEFYELDHRLHFTSKIWVANIFRAWEWLFGREFGIRREASLSSNYKNRAFHVGYEVFTLEALLTYFECTIRMWIKTTIEWAGNPQLSSMPRPVYLTLGILGFYFSIKTNTYHLPLFGLSIATDTSGHTSGGGSTLSYTMGSVSNGLLVVTCSRQDSNHANFPISSITYGASTLTSVRQDSSSSNNVSSAIQYLLAPSSGTATITVNGGSVTTLIVASSWSGVKQSAQPDAQAGKGTANQSSSSPSQSITTVANNSVIIDCISSEANRTSLGGGQTSIGTDQGQSFENVSSSYLILATAGAQTMSAGLSSGQPYNMSVASFSPAAGVTTAIVDILDSTGVLPFAR